MARNLAEARRLFAEMGTTGWGEYAMLVSQTVAVKISGQQTDSTFRRYDISSDDDLVLAAEWTAAHTERLPESLTVRQLSETERTPRHSTPGMTATPG